MKAHQIKRLTKIVMRTEVLSLSSKGHLLTNHLHNLVKV